MKLKQKPGDFRVRELLKDGVLQPSGKHHVYRVTKRKLTSMEAAEVLASMANVKVSDISMAGLKDRQGVTEQFMSFPGGKRVELNTPELKLISAGCMSHSLSSADSYGNAFEVRLRELTPIEQKRLLAHQDIVGRMGVPNYFDEQRFGNLRHGQGWVAKELMLGNHEQALKNLLCAESPHDSGSLGAFKSQLRNDWGDWAACRDIAGRFGQHHSVFDHLRKEPTDFAGAFYHISSRLRLIHLYAFQSHIWNRAVASYFARISGDGGARVGFTLEGPQVFPDRKLEVAEDFNGSFRLPGEGLEDVENKVQRELLEWALHKEGLTPERYRIQGVSGFQLKGEDRRLFIRPRNLRVDLGSPDKNNEGTGRLSFELPRGAYATLVVRSLLAAFWKDRIDLERLEREDPHAVGDSHQGQRQERGSFHQGHGTKGAQRGRSDQGNWSRGSSNEGRSYGSNRRQDSRSENRQGSWSGGGKSAGGWSERDRSGERSRGSYGGGQREQRGSYGGGQREQRGSYGGGQREQRDSYGGGQREQRGSYGGGQREQRGSYGDGQREQRGAWGASSGGNQDRPRGSYGSSQRDRQDNQRSPWGASARDRGDSSGARGGDRQDRPQQRDGQNSREGQRSPWGENRGGGQNRERGSWGGQQGGDRERGSYSSRDGDRQGGQRSPWGGQDRGRGSSQGGDRRGGQGGSWGSQGGDRQRGSYGSNRDQNRGGQYQGGQRDSWGSQGRDHRQDGASAGGDRSGGQRGAWGGGDRSRGSYGSRGADQRRDERSPWAGKGGGQHRSHSSGSGDRQGSKWGSGGAKPKEERRGGWGDKRGRDDGAREQSSGKRWEGANVPPPQLGGRPESDK